MKMELFIDAASALGTVAAVAVALYLSRKSDSKRAADEARLQRMHALYLLPVLEGYFEDLRHSSGLVVFLDEDPKSMQDVAERLLRAKKWAEDFEKHSAHSALSAESLLMLPEIVGFRISRALGLLHSLRIEISRFNPEEWEQSHKAVASKAASWAATQSLASDLIAVAIQDIRAKADANAVYPSGQELHGDPYEE